MVSVQGATVTYAATPALKDVSVDIAKGEFLTLLGPSGSGKTTLLNAIAGIVPLTRGRILIDGTDVTHVPLNLRGLGMVFQNYALMPHLTVFENVAFPLRVRGLPSATIRQKVSKALDLVRLTGLDQRRPRQLSGGQQQRVSLARAIVYEPKVILMDEPLGALDKQLREEMQVEIRHLHVVLGTTIIYVTHDQEEALSMSTNIALVSDGVIHETGAPQDIYFKPRSRFAASFVGTSNLLSGTYEGSEGKWATVSVSGRSRIRGVAHENLSIGDRVSIMFRPEVVQITQDANEASPDLNVIDGDVFDHFLQGATWKTIVAVGDADRVIVQCLAQSSGQLPRNTKVRLAWHPDDTHLLTR